MKTNICPICVMVSSLWLILSAGIVWGDLPPEPLLIPIALLMGGSVVGIAYLGEKKFLWAVQNPQQWKTLVILIGMPIAYLLVRNLNEFTVAVEFLIIIVIAYFFFIKRPSKPVSGSTEKIRKIEEQMEQCC